VVLEQSTGTPAPLSRFIKPGWPRVCPFPWAVKLQPGKLPSDPLSTQEEAAGHHITYPWAFTHA
jgi:hypothetical protein